MDRTRNEQHDGSHHCDMDIWVARQHHYRRAYRFPIHTRVQLQWRLGRLGRSRGYVHVRLPTPVARRIAG
jgi:hypothetical protein